MALLFLSNNLEINVTCLRNIITILVIFFFKAVTFETPKGTATAPAAVILGFKTLSSTNSQISPPERYDEHPSHFLKGITPPPGGGGATSHISEESFLTKK